MIILGGFVTAIRDEHPSGITLERSKSKLLMFAILVVGLLKH